MIRLDHAYLADIGLGALTLEDRGSLLACISETLERRVGLRLAQRMTHEQLTEFEATSDPENDQAGLTMLTE